MTVQLALYKGKGQIGNAAIRFWTDSDYSHCELVANGWCYSSSVMDKGVRRKRVGPGSDEIGLGHNWELIDLPWADAAEIERYYEKTKDDTYGWPSLIVNQLFNLNRDIEHAAFCSEWCARAINFPDASIYNPDTLGSMVRWVNYMLPTFSGKGFNQPLTYQ